METEVKSDSPKGPDPVGPAETMQEELPSLREHEPLEELLSQIPRKAQKGMLTQCDLVLTCIDANEDYIALGTNVGLIFVFDQKKRTVEHKLRTESNNDTISVVQLHKGLDSQVAMGTNGGIIYIFQLPSSLPGQNKQLQQFVVRNLHHSSITSLSWSPNGMKLFSGDKRGLVVCTDVDFYEKRCESSVSLEEKQSEIVQLHQCHKSLLVSTLHRSFVYRPKLTDNKLAQIGKKDRKILGNYGACFIPGLCKSDDAQLYAARPGLRIWKAGINGVVLNTNLFKDLLSQAHRDIPIIPYQGQTRTQLKSSDQQFGTLHLYRDKYLVTWSSSHLYLLNPDTTTVVASQARLGVLVGVAVTEDDIFILRRNTSRNVVRLGLKPLAKQESVYERLVRERQLAADAVKNKRLQQGSTDNARDPDVRPKSDKPSKSPLKFLQENVLDKFKVLDKVAGTGVDNSVSHFVSSINRFGHDDEVDGSHSQEIDRSQTTGQSTTHKMSHDSDSPSKTLPPVVQLDTPDLLTIEIFSGIPPTTENFSSEKPFTYKSSPYKGRFNPFLSDPVSDTDADEICTDLLGTVGGTSEKSQEEDKQDTVSQSSENLNLPDEPTSPQPKFMIEKLDKVLKNESSTDDIVFTHKQKKGRKKRKHAKEKDGEGDSHGKAMEVTPVSTELQSEDKQQDELPRSISPDSKSGEPDVESLDMDEPEDADKFREISRELESFERTLTDLPGQSMQTQNTTEIKDRLEEGHQAIVKERTTVGGQETEGNASEVESDGTKPGVIPEVVNAGDHTVTGLQDNGHIGSVIPGMLGVQIVQSAHIHTEQPKEKYVNNECVKNKEENLSDSSSVTVTPITLSDSCGVTLTPSTISDSREVPMTESPLSLVVTEEEEEEEDSIYSSKKKEASQEPVRDKMDDLVKDTRQYFPYKTPDASIEDIYGKTGGLTPSPSESVKGLTSSGIKDDKQTVKIADPSETIPQSLINNWGEATTGGNLYSLTLSNSHVWVVDKSCNVYHSSLQGGRLKWQKIKDYGQQIAVSRSGYIVWRLYKGTVYAGAKITPRHPEGMKWVEAVRNVHFVAVDNNCAWYIKTTGEVMVQNGLSKDRPCFKSSVVPGEESLRFRQVACQDRVVWGVTEECKLMYRQGVSEQCPAGKDWLLNDHVGEDTLFSYVALGDKGVGWGMDILGRIWFITGVAMDTPMGQECWWQVPVSEILIQDETAMDSLRSLAKKFDPQKLAHLLSTQRGGLLTAGEGGVWVCPEFKNTLQICRGSMEGHSWREVNMAGFTSSIAWKILSASVSNQKHSLVWCVQPNGDVFTLSPSTGHTKSVESPSPRYRLVGLSACPDAVWGLAENGFVFIRSGVRPECPQGTEWVNLDLRQLGDVHLMSVSCGHTNVWALDSNGVVYQRIGVKAPSSHSLIQAWLPVDSGTSGTTFSQICSGPRDCTVWAIDNRRQVYTRTGITDSMPIGTSWVHVPGTLAHQITISERNVWALNPAGEILCRYGVTPENPTGDYWRKVPGVFVHISTSSSDDIWAINQDGHIYRRRTRFLLRKQTGSDPLLEKRIKRGISSSSDDGWELV